MRTRIIATTALIVTSIGTIGAVAAHAAPDPTLPYGATWTVDPTTNTLTEYAAGATGTDAPIATVSGAATGLSQPSALAIDSKGRVYVANAGNNSITEYAANATNNAAPLTTISGARTLLDGPSSIAIVGGQIWVTNPDSDLVEAFATGSNGNEYPAATLAGARTKIDHPIAVAVGVELEDEIGGETADITVVNAPSSGTASISQFSSTRLGDVKPDTRITDIDGHAIGSPTALFTSDGFDFLLADGASNSIRSFGLFPGDDTAESGPTIHGSSTGLDDPVAISEDAFGDTVVANAGSHSLEVFGFGAKGNAAPKRTLTGVGDPAGAAVLGTSPGAPQNVKVKVNKGSAHLTWKAPDFTGGGLLGYEVIAIQVDQADSLLTLLGLGGGVRIQATTKTSITMTRIKPGHQYVFEVAAINAFGGRAGRPVEGAYVLPPSAPYHVKAFARAHSALVSWKSPRKTGGGRIGRYTVEYAAGCNPSADGCHAKHVTINAPRSIIQSAAGPNTTIHGLTSKTAYEIQVIAHNKAGKSKPSRVTKITTS